MSPSPSGPSLGISTAPLPSLRIGTYEEFLALLPASLRSVFPGSFTKSSDLYEELIDRLVLQVFRETGIEPALRDPGTAEDIAARAGLEPGRALIPLAWMLRRLALRHAVDEVGEDGPSRRYRARGPLPELDPAPVREQQRELDAGWLPSYAMADIVAEHYPAFLRGELTGEEILFSPARFMRWFDYFSNDNSPYAVNNHVGAVAVLDWLPRGGGVILELGGGLASGAIAVIDRLAAAARLPEVREYRFTEHVPAFLRRGQRALTTRFPTAPPLTFGALDMNRPFEEQGVPPGSVTVVYAVNTLHVAHDLAFTLAEIFRALAPGGQLIASECVRPWPGQPVYAEFIFNLMATFRAPRLHLPWRPNGGFLTADQWTAAVEAAGFTNVRLLPDALELRKHFSNVYVAAVGATRP